MSLVAGRCTNTDKYRAGTRGDHGAQGRAPGGLAEARRPVHHQLGQGARGCCGHHGGQRQQVHRDHEAAQVSCAARAARSAWVWASDIWDTNWPAARHRCRPGRGARYTQAPYCSREATGPYRCALPAFSLCSQPFLYRLSITVSTCCMPRSRYSRRPVSTSPTVTGSARSHKRSMIAASQVAEAAQSAQPPSRPLVLTG